MVPVVLSIVHPCEATAATLADGTVVTPVDARGALRPEVQSVVDEWANEDALLALETAAHDREAQLRILRPYLAALPKTDAALRRWVLGRRSNLLAGRQKWAWEQVSVEVHRPARKR